MAEKYTLTLDLADAEVTVSVEQSDIPLRGNVMASGDDATDQEAEQWVIDQLNSGNDFAWCDVFVSAELGGFRGWDSLAACSCNTKEELQELINDHGMVENALDHLRQQLREAGAKLTVDHEEDDDGWGFVPSIPGETCEPGDK